jgi:hypothetical protein
MLDNHGFMLIRVVLAVNVFIFSAGFSEKNVGERLMRAASSSARLW